MTPALEAARRAAATTLLDQIRRDPWRSVLRPLAVLCRVTDARDTRRLAAQALLDTVVYLLASRPNAAVTRPRRPSGAGQSKRGHGTRRRAIAAAGRSAGRGAGRGRGRK